MNRRRDGTPAAALSLISDPWLREFQHLSSFESHGEFLTAGRARWFYRLVKDDMISLGAGCNLGEGTKVDKEAGTVSNKAAKGGNAQHVFCVGTSRRLVVLSIDGAKMLNTDPALVDKCDKCRNCKLQRYRRHNSSRVWAAVSTDRQTVNQSAPRQPLAKNAVPET